MTPLGHTLMGATIGLVAAPRHARWWHKGLTVAAFAVLANLPDLRVAGWGHDRYDISHSIFVNLAILAVLTTVILSTRRLRQWIGGPRVVLLGAAAWLSHLFLDSTYNHGKGLAMFWPVSEARLSLSLPWFSTVRKPLPHVDSHTIRVMLIELAFYGTLFAIVAILRRRKTPAVPE